MKYVSIFHANLNYSYLVPEKYEFVIRASYELLIDTMRECFPNTKYVFEASGRPIVLGPFRARMFEGCAAT